MSVAWTSVNGSATAPSDYTASSGTVAFEAGSQTATITVAITNDGVSEQAETFTVLLSTPIGIVFGDNAAVVTIIDSSPPAAVVSAAAVDASGSEQGPNPLVFTVSRTGSTPTALIVNLSWTGTASSGDYTVAVSGGTLAADRSTVTIAAGSATATLTITPVNDIALEPTESVTLTVLPGAGYALGAVASATGAIDDNDVAVSVVATDSAGAEQGSNTIVLTATRSGFLAASTAVNLVWTGSAALGTDYSVTVSGATLSSDRLTLTFAAGADTATLTLTPIDDAAVEGDETATLTIGSGISYTVGTPSSASGTILDNDSAPVLPTISTAVTDGAGAEAATDPIVFTVTRAGSTTGTTTVNLTWTGTAALTTDYTVAVAGTGVTLSSNRLTLTFAAGATTATLTVTPVNDAIAEGSESVTMTIASGTGYTVGTPPSATASIADNDATALSIADASRLEGNNGTSTVLVTVTLSAASAGTVTVTYSTGGGSATAGTDYVSTSGTLTFSPGETSRTISVVIRGDRTRGEGNETFLITLTSPSGATLADGQAVVTILDDDGATRAGAIGSNGDTATLDAVTARAVLVAAAATWGDALDGIDLATISIEIADLPFDLLAQTSPDGSTIVIDVNGAGWGWSVDPAATASIDLLTVLAHELGHVLGFEHGVSELMDEMIQPGRRELPELIVAPALAGPSAGHSAVRPVDPITTWGLAVGRVVQHTVAEPLRSTAAATLAIDAAITVPRVDRAARAIAGVSLPSQAPPTPVAPASVSWLLLALAIALAAPRRRPLLRVPRQ
jgi:hypothetical protein